MALKLRTHLLLVLLFFAFGVLLYLFAVLSSFGSAAFGYDSLVVVALTVVGGLGALILGYASVVVLGGRVSIWVVEFFARFTRSRHVIEAADDKPSTLRDRIGKEYFTFVLPMLVFVIAATLAWDVHNLHDPRTLIFHDLLHVLDVFSKPVTVEPMSYSLEMLLAMLVLVAIAGIVPSIVLPYFRRFKVTGVNSGPFHTDLLFTVVGFVVGLGALLAVLGLVYEVLWVGKGPSYYHYVVPVMLGLSVHYSIGSSWGRDRAETMVQRMLEAREGRRIVRGKVNIQGIRTKNNSTNGDKVRSRGFLIDIKKRLSSKTIVDQKSYIFSTVGESLLATGQGLWIWFLTDRPHKVVFLRRGKALRREGRGERYPMSLCLP